VLTLDHVGNLEAEDVVGVSSIIWTTRGMTSLMMLKEVLASTGSGMPSLYRASMAGKCGKQRELLSSGDSAGRMACNPDRSVVALNVCPLMSENCSSRGTYTGELLVSVSESAF
jgi:hypothetical protein